MPLFADKRCNKGRVKLAVLPVPVCAPAIISPPDNTTGIACVWIGVGLSYPRSVTARTISGDKPRLEKDIELQE